MPHTQAFAAAGIAALGVAWLIAVQMVLTFRTSDEFGLVMGAITADLAIGFAILVFVVSKLGSERVMTLSVLGVALATLMFSGWPVWMDAVEARSSNPYPSSHRDAQIVLEFLAPCLAGLVVLWRLLVRAYRKALGQDARTLWPWFTIGAGLVLVFNPLGIEVVGSAIAPSATDWLASLWRFVAVVAAAVLVVLAVIEFALRARRLRLPVQAEV
ncbi:hypothetical protein [Bradyrhizobium neotropicale]|uniref:Uncharacterized protein n=1 Tax=Bradyrhizobium neotropicale TaxID=1497615 RepID=A0A176Z4F4_9BRAD|nr:hypothetical protein [Bradyrhizobium neotropicale]OAF15044.1 hypothetical protein AXW67_16920 [Bradyrhizobium neotropicale]